MANENYQWSDNDTRTNLLHAEVQFARKVKGFWSGFLDFALRDNVLEVAVGLIIASTFTAVVNSLVSDVILPPISLLPFMSRNMEEKFWVLREGPHFHSGYNTRKQAIDDGAVIMTYGVFFGNIMHFVAIGATLYLVASVYGFLSKDSIIKHLIKCPYCRKYISEKARRCPLCTTWQDGREDVETSALPPPQRH